MFSEERGRRAETVDNWIGLLFDRAYSCMRPDPGRYSLSILHQLVCCLFALTAMMVRNPT